MSMFQTLKPKPKHHESGGTCLLLDISGSMDNRIPSEEEGVEPRAIEVLFKAVRETPECAGLKPFVFGSDCHPIELIPSEEDALNFNTSGSTNLGGAFEAVKRSGFYSAILVTDGVPDSEQYAITSAIGMRLGIIYIGPPPVPGFLKRLAEATDGTFALADLRDIKALESAIVGALPPPDETPSGSGAINL